MGRARPTMFSRSCGAIMHWHATRHDDYAAPIVKGMRRTNPQGARPHPQTQR